MILEAMNVPVTSIKTKNTLPHNTNTYTSYSSAKFLDQY